MLDSTVVFNEIMYNPSGETDDALEWVELYNQLAVDLDISEWAIEGGVDYQVPAGTVLPGREYLVVAVDPAGLQTETGFSDALGPFTGRLANGGEELRLVNNDGRVMNVLDYGDEGDWPVGPDGGGASLAKRDPFTSTEATDNWTSSIVLGGTPGAINFSDASTPTYPIALNEIASASASDFWLEIVNRGSQSVDLGGFKLVATGTEGGEYAFPPQSLGPGEYLQVAESELGFRPADGEKLFLYAPDGEEQLLDAQVVSNRLRGRSEELGGAWLYPDAATPGAANSFQLRDEIVINEIMYHAFPNLGSPGAPAAFETTSLVEIDQDTLWRYNPTGDFLPANWAQTSHGVDGVDWFEGPALIGYDTNPSAVAGTIRTALDAPSSNNPYVITYYFETEFEFDGDLSQIDGLEISHVIDDGAIFYLNGVELAEARFGMPAGPVNAGTTANSTVGDAGAVGPVSIPKELLQVGVNRLSVEVHQSNNSSSDIIFGAELRARRQIGEPTPGQPYSESDEEWIELYNRGDSTVDLGGWSIADAVDFEFPAGTELAPGEYLVVARDSATLQEKYPTIEIVGDFSRRLSDREDRILLVDALGNPADEVQYYESGRWSLYADGGGSSLELRDPDSDNNQAEAWAASDESTKSTWQTYTYRGVSSEPLSVGANLQHFILGLLDEGEFLLDDVSVVRDPGGANREVIVNGTFENDPIGSTPAGWRLVGNHASGSVQLDDGNKVLHFIAEGPQQHIHDHVTVDFGNGESIQDGQEYEITLRAKWLAGSAQLNNRFYFTRMANTFILDVPEHNGTPGAENSTFEVNVGPTYSDLVQHPVFPSPGEPVTISVRAGDPDGIGSIDLRYAASEGTFASAPMTLNDDGVYQGIIPGQSTGSVVQFYVEGEDALGASSTFPAAGVDSRALYEVGARSDTRRPIDSVHILMLDSDQSDLQVRYNEMSNMYFGATIVHTINADDGPIQVAYHDVEVRQVGSRFIRPNSGYKIRLRPDQKFYGVHESIRLDMSLPGEIYMKHMVARAGGSSVSMYDDVANMVDPRHGRQTVLLQLARYEDTFLRGQFVDGNEGTKWELDDIVIPTQPVQLGYNSDQAIQNQDIRYRGDDPEFYRGHLLIKNQRYKDNYQAIVDFAWAINRTGQQQLYDATNAVMDVDLWMRHYATQSFLGNWDTYGFRRPKNLRIYVRPEDGMIIPLFWDADRGNLSDPFVYNGGVSRLDDIRDIPQNLRLFWGHMWDLTNRSFNGDYMAPWLSHYSQLGLGMPSASQLSSRANSARSQAQSAIPPVAFEITTNGGNGFSVDQAGATLEGAGWIDVRNLRVAGSETPLEVTWTGVDTWRIEVPLAPGANDVTIEAYDFESGLIGSDSIAINSTVSDRPLQDYLRITELNYHPTEPTSAEQAAGYDDQDDFEFVELLNTGPVTLDLTGVQFVDGIDYTFGDAVQLEPGEFLVLAANSAAVQFRYGLEVDVAGQYDGSLRNSGEQLVLADAFGATILDFTYGDSDAPGWPDAADGLGSSLVVVDADG
ncbi:MAG: lamin tail domain-containing protein, partial [Planctomycetota bacterium]